MTKLTSNIYNKHVIDSLKIVIGNLRLRYMNKEYNLPVALAKRHFIITLYECYLDKHPDNLVAWYAKRLALNRLGGPNEAIYRFNKAINKDPKAGGSFESFSRNVTINK